MVNDKQLIPGAFYWVIPKAESDAADDWQPGQEWQDEIQPARFNGWNAAGEMLWNFMGFDGSSDWPVLWVGEAIGVPMPTKPALAQMCESPLAAGQCETAIGSELVVDVGLLHDAVRGMPGLYFGVDWERLPGARVAPDVMIPLAVPFEPASVFFEDSLHFRREVRHSRGHPMSGPRDLCIQLERHFVAISVSVFVEQFGDEDLKFVHQRIHRLSLSNEARHVVALGDPYTCFRVPEGRHMNLWHVRSNG